MEYTIENQSLKVTIDHVGAQLWSIQSKVDNQEYLWQGDATYWSDRAINLFPVCGRLWDGGYAYQGKKYPMPIHGFLNATPTQVISHTEDSIVFRLQSDETTKAMYPFDFQLDITYTLSNDTISLDFDVTNLGDVTMPFSVGGHPGFQMPFDGGDFSDYVLEFSQPSAVKALSLTEACYMTQQYVMLPLEQGRTMHLTHQLFDNDALVLTDCAPAVTLKRPGGTKAITVSYPNMKYLGIWHKPKSQAPYVCIEPWTGVPAYTEQVDDLETKQDLHHLPAHQQTQYSLSIAIQV